MKGKCFRGIILCLWVIGTVNLAMKPILAWDDLHMPKFPTNHPLNGLNQEMMRSQNSRNLETWQVSARGEVSEDCLLYGICSDSKKD